MVKAPGAVSVPELRSSSLDGSKHSFSHSQGKVVEVQCINVS
jgi:hypothetical protein